MTTLRTLICLCGHSAHWHEAADLGGGLVQGAGRCDDCECRRFAHDNCAGKGFIDVTVDLDGGHGTKPCWCDEDGKAASS